MELVAAGTVTLLLLLVAGRVWQQRNPDLATYNRLPSRTQRRIATSVYTGGPRPEDTEGHVAPGDVARAVREFETSAFRWNRPAPTLLLWLAATAVFLASATATRGGFDAGLLLWVAPFWLGVLPGVLRWQHLRRRALEHGGSDAPALCRSSPAKFAMVFLISWLPLTVLLTNLTMMIEAATGVGGNEVAGGVHGGLAVAYLVWLAPVTGLRGAWRVFVGWALVLTVAAAALMATGVRPTDAL